jgi:hypothetical protein
LGGGPARVRTPGPLARHKKRHHAERPRDRHCHGGPEKPCRRERRSAAEGRPQPPQQPSPATVGDDGRLVIGDLRLSADDIKSIMAEKAQRDSRIANAPKDAASYALDLPENFELPVGAEGWQWNTDDPMTAALFDHAKEFAFKHGLDQSAFSQMISLYASHEVAEAARFNEARRGEIEKLGANAAVRVDSVATWLDAMVGSELSSALTRTMFTSNQVRAFERLMRSFVSQGVSGNPAGARDGAHGREPARLSEEAYSRLSFTEKQQYAAQFDQSRFSR